MPRPLWTLEDVADWLDVEPGWLRRVAVDTGELRPQASKAVAVTSGRSGMFFADAEVNRWWKTKRQPYTPTGEGVEALLREWRRQRGEPE